MLKALLLWYAPQLQAATALHRSLGNLPRPVAVPHLQMTTLPPTIGDKDGCIKPCPCHVPPGVAALGRRAAPRPSLAQECVWRHPNNVRATTSRGMIQQQGGVELVSCCCQCFILRSSNGAWQLLP